MYAVAISFNKWTTGQLVSGWTVCPERFDRRQGTANESLVRKDIFFVGSWNNHKHQLLSKKSKKCSDSSALDTASDQAQMLSNPPLIRSNRRPRTWVVSSHQVRRVNEGFFWWGLTEGEGEGQTE